MIERLTNIFKRKGSTIDTTEAKPEVPTRNIFALTEGGDVGEVDSLLTAEQLQRRELTELERIYFLDYSVFSGINMIANHVTAPGSMLEGSSEDARDKVKAFLKQIGFMTTINRLVRHALIFGRAYGEIVYNKMHPSTKLVDFVSIDPKSIDLIRDTATEIPQFDTEGDFVGYVQKDTMTGKDKYFKKDELEAKGQYPKIIHFSLYGLSLGHRGIGLIEPLYKAMKIKMNLEHSFGEVAHRIGLPIIWAKLGDDYLHPTDDQLKDFGEQLKEIHNRNQIVTDSSADIKLLQPKDISPLENVLNYFKSAVSSGLGVPELLLYGSGAGVNRATSDALLEQFFRNVQTFQTFFAEKIQVLVNRYCELEIVPGLPEGQREAFVPPQFSFKDARPQRLNEFAVRMQQYTKSGIVTPTKELEAHVSDLEGLPQPAESRPEEKPEEELKKEKIKETPLPKVEDELAENMEKSYENLVERTLEALRKHGK